MNDYDDEQNKRYGGGIMTFIHLKNIFFIIVGSIILAIGIVHFNMENNLGEGGLTGVTLLLYYLWGINPAISYFVINIPLFIIGWRFLSVVSFIYTIIGTIFVSLFLNFFQTVSFTFNLQSDMTLVALFAGLLSGLGLGIIFRFGGTTGGIDIIARILFEKIGWPLGKTMFIFDVIVITTSIFTILNLVQGMYTIVAVYISAKVIDLIQEGAYAARGAFIISNHHDEIIKAVHLKLNRGVTIIKAKGSYSKRNIPILYCIIDRNEVIQLKKLTKEIDDRAFFTIFQVSEVIGEGFNQQHNDNK